MRNPTLKKLGLRKPRTVAELRAHPLTLEVVKEGDGVWSCTLIEGYYFDSTDSHHTVTDFKTLLEDFNSIEECSNGYCYYCKMVAREKEWLACSASISKDETPEPPPTGGWQSREAQDRFEGNFSFLRKKK